MKKIVIVGGGIAGLTAGVYARKAGFEAEIYEKNARAGGQCTGWDRKGCHIDNCIHWLTGTKEGTGLRKLWEEIGALSPDTKFVKSDKFYTSCVDGERITLWKDLERTKREMLSLSPEDSEEIERFIEHVEYAGCCEMPVDQPMDRMSLSDYIRMGKDMRDMPKVMKNYGKISLKDLGSRFRHPALRAVFTDYMPGDYTASSFLVSYATVACGNGEIPEGGSVAMAERIVQRFKNLGGKLFCGCPVRKIIVRGKKAGGVLLEDGREIAADYVVSAVDTFEMFDRLLGKEYMSSEWRRCYGDEQAYPLFSNLHAAFCIDRSRYGETESFFFNCTPFPVNGKTVGRLSVKSYEYEPGFAPEGKTVLQCSLNQSDDDYRYWKALGREEYEEKKKALAETLQARITERFPSLVGHMELLDCWTPVTYERYCNSYHGAYMSFITKKGVKSFRSKGVFRHPDNLFIASQWLQAPGGLPAAAAAGKFAVQRITSRESARRGRRA